MIFFCIDLARAVLKMLMCHLLQEEVGHSYFQHCVNFPLCSTSSEQSEKSTRHQPKTVKRQTRDAAYLQGEEPVCWAALLSAPPGPRGADPPLHRQRRGVEDLGSTTITVGKTSASTRGGRTWEHLVDVVIQRAHVVVELLLGLFLFVQRDDARHVCKGIDRGRFNELLFTPSSLVLHFSADLSRQSRSV